MRSVCNINDCPKYVVGAGYCQLHYRRYQTTGDPLKASKRQEKHGMSGTPEYRTYISMMGRCYNSKHPAYRHYGGRGISVCETWRISFMAFYNEIGPKPSKKHSIDRINNDGNYEPSNVRWVTQEVQLRNRRVTKLFEYNGEKHTVNEWASILGVSKHSLYVRLVKYGWDTETAFSTPYTYRKPHYKTEVMV